MDAQGDKCHRTCILTGWPIFLARSADLVRIKGDTVHKYALAK